MEGGEHGSGLDFTMGITLDHDQDPPSGVNSTLRQDVIGIGLPSTVSCRFRKSRPFSYQKKASLSSFFFFFHVSVHGIHYLCLLMWTYISTFT